MASVLPWLAEVMAACEANYEARQQAAKRAESSTPPPQSAPTEPTLHEQVAAAVQAPASPNGIGPAAEDRRTPPPPPAAEGPSDTDPSWCAIHICTMEQHSNARGIWWSHYLGTDAHGKRRYCKGA